MGWRRGELWFEADVAWFGEGAAAPAVAGLALPPLPSFGPTGLACLSPASRGVEAAAEDARDRLHAAAGRDGSAGALSKRRRRRGGPRGRPAEPDVPHRPADPRAGAWPGRCTDAEAVARDRNRTLGRISEDRVAQRDIGWPVVERKPDRRHPAPRRGPELGDLEPGYGLGPERAEAAPRERAHDPHDRLGHRRVPRREPPGTTRRRG